MLEYGTKCKANGLTRRVAATATAALCVGLAVAVLMLGGCYEEMSRTNPWAQLEEKAASQGWGTAHGGAAAPAAGADFRPTAMATEGWSILVRAFEGPKAARNARALKGRLAEELRVPDLWVRDEHGQVVVYRGRYDPRHLPDAKRDLRQTRMLVLDGRRPFGEAALVGLDLGAVGMAADESVAGSDAAAVMAADDANLRRHIGEAEYSLQVAFFDEAGGANYREAAQSYARQLRERGEEAFYLHGRTMSLVTVGLFSESDLETHRAVGADGVPMISQSYGPRVRELQRRFPHNLGNGMTLVESVGDGGTREAPSFVVRLPTP